MLSRGIDVAKRYQISCKLLQNDYLVLGEANIVELREILEDLHQICSRFYIELGRT